MALVIGLGSALLVALTICSVLLVDARLLIQRVEQRLQAAGVGEQAAAEVDRTLAAATGAEEYGEEFRV